MSRTARSGPHRAADAARKGARTTRDHRAERRVHCLDLLTRQREEPGAQWGATNVSSPRSENARPRRTRRGRHRAGQVAATVRLPVVSSAHHIAEIQRLAGNGAVARLSSIQRCGSVAPDDCGCHPAAEVIGEPDLVNGTERAVEPVQRTADPVGRASSCSATEDSGRRRSWRPRYWQVPRSKRRRRRPTERSR